MISESEKTLWQRISLGDLKAEAEIAKLYWKNFQTACRHATFHSYNPSTVNREDVEEICNLVFLKAIRSYRMDGGSTFRNYLIVCVNNQVWRLKYRQNKLNRITVSLDALLKTKRGKDNDDLNCLTVGKPLLNELAGIVPVIFSLLSPQEKTFLTLMHFYEWTRPETARIMAINKQRSHQIIKSAEKKSKELVDKWLGGEKMGLEGFPQIELPKLCLGRGCINEVVERGVCQVHFDLGNYDYRTNKAA